MQVTERLTKQLTEVKYLNADNADRYRCIMRIFYEHYEKLRYWLYQEDIYAEMIRDDYFKDYRIEQCQQDLTALVEWKNLVTIQDTRKVASIEEFKNKKFRYQMSEYSVEIERLVLRLETLLIEGASLEPTLLERIRLHLDKLERMAGEAPEAVYSWWTDLNNDFARLNQNYQDYIRDLNSVKAEEMMKTKEFLIFKDKLIEYLRSFIKGLQKNVGVIEEIIQSCERASLDQLFEKIITYELSIPRLDVEVSEAMLAEKNRGRWDSITDWFVGRNGQENEAGKLFDATNDIIRRITRYASQLSEKSSLGANRREECLKVASVFLKCEDLTQAHKLSAMVFGLEKPAHFKGDAVRETESLNAEVYAEKPLDILIKPRIRTYREKARRSSMNNYQQEKEAVRKQTLVQLRRDQEAVEALEVQGEIRFSELPVIEARVREILLKWLSDAMESPGFTSKTEDGREFYLQFAENGSRCVVHCEDGNFTMPEMSIIFRREQAE